VPVVVPGPRCEDGTQVANPERQELPSMNDPQPFVREAGAGPGVVCLHSNASSSAQWRGLMDRLAPAFRVFAPDSYGSGKSPDWPSPRTITLADEVALVEPVLARAGPPFALVGHSYGAAVALKAALADPGRVFALALYEPTLFSLVEAQGPAPNDADGIRDAVARAGAALDAGDADAAARSFIDYWMDAGSWERTPEARKPAIAASVTNVRRWAHALMTEPAPLEAFRALEMPVLYLTGKRSTRSAHGVARLLAHVLPNVEVLEFEQLGHMGPITDPDRVNQEIAAFLERAWPGPR
jgi:pimeloyl-ACP methyl ester carboxylesterase